MILDYMLGKINGLDVLQKAGQLDNKVRIIMMSGYQAYDLPAVLPDAQSAIGMQAGLPQRAQKLGAAGFLPKPFMIRALLHAVENSRRKI